MLKNIKKIVPPRRFAVPLLGLALALSAIVQRAQPVLSEQIALLQTTSPSKALKEESLRDNGIEEEAEVVSASISKEVRLRRVLNSSSPQPASTGMNLSPGETYTWIQRNTSSDTEGFGQESGNIDTPQARIRKSKASSKEAIPATNFPNGNGVFLYGSSQRTGQFGKGYIVLEKQEGKVVGGMYMPSSEFNCFQGTLDDSGEIAMTVKGYAGDIHPTQVASSNRLPKINDSESTNYSYSVTLQDYYQIDAVGENDQRILQACKEKFQ